MDREKARARAGLGPDIKKAPKAPLVDLGGGVKYNPLQPDSDDDEDMNAKSILVQMRRKAKEEEENNRKVSSQQQQNFQNSTGGTKDAAAVDEWMGKPQKVPLDIIDTQKFAAIVKQKLGSTGSNKEEKKPPPPPTSHMIKQDRERDHRGSREEAKSRHENRKPDLRMELSMNRAGGHRDRGGGHRDRGVRDRGRRRYDL